MNKKIISTLIAMLTFGSDSIKSFAMQPKDQMSEGLVDSNLLFDQFDFTAEQKLTLSSKGISISDALKFKNKFIDDIDEEDMIDYIISLLSGNDALSIDDLQKFKKNGVSLDTLKSIKDAGYLVDESTKPFFGRYDGIHHLYASEIIKCLKNNLNVEEVFKFKNAGFTINEMIEYTRCFGFSDAVFLKENFVDPKTAEEYRAVGLDICESVICAQNFIRPECVNGSVVDCFKKATRVVNVIVGDPFREISLKESIIVNAGRTCTIDNWHWPTIERDWHWPIDGNCPKLELEFPIKPCINIGDYVVSFSTENIKPLDGEKIEEDKYEKWKDSGFSSEDIMYLADCGVICSDAVKFKEHFKEIVDEKSMTNYMVSLLSGDGAASVDDLIELSDDGAVLEDLKTFKILGYPINEITKPFFKKCNGFRRLSYLEVIRFLDNNLRIEEVVKFIGAFKNVIDEDKIVDYMVSLLSGDGAASVDDLIELSNDGAILEDLKTFKILGYPINETTKPFFKKCNGFRNLNHSEVIRCLDNNLKIEEVVKFIDAFKNVIDEDKIVDCMVSLLSGDGAVSVDDLIELSSDGVSLDTLKEFKDQGYKIDKSTKSFLEKYDGVRHLCSSEIIKCLDMDLKVVEVFKFKNAGFSIDEMVKYSKNFSFAESVFLKNNSISPEDAEAYKDLKVNVCETVFLKRNGVFTFCNVQEIIKKLKYKLQLYSLRGN